MEDGEGCFLRILGPRRRRTRKSSANFINVVYSCCLFFFIKKERRNISCFLFFCPIFLALGLIAFLPFFSMDWFKVLPMTTFFLPEAETGVTATAEVTEEVGVKAEMEPGGEEEAGDDVLDWVVKFVVFALVVLLIVGAGFAIRRWALETYF